MKNLIRLIYLGAKLLYKKFIPKKPECVHFCNNIVSYNPKKIKIIPAENFNGFLLEFYGQQRVKLIKINATDMNQEYINRLVLELESK